MVVLKFTMSHSSAQTVQDTNSQELNVSEPSGEAFTHNPSSIGSELFDTNEADNFYDADDHQEVMVRLEKELSDLDEETSKDKKKRKKKRGKQVSFNLEKIGVDDKNKKKIDKLKVPKSKVSSRKIRRASPHRVNILPTYRRTSINPMNPDIVRMIVHKVFDHFLHKNQPWPGDAAKVSLKAFQLSGVIRDTIERFRFERYKTVCLVDLIEKPKVTDGTYDTPSYISGYTVLYDVKKDAVVSATWENKYFVCSCIVFGCYAE